MPDDAVERLGVRRDRRGVHGGDHDARRRRTLRVSAVAPHDADDRGPDLLGQLFAYTEVFDMQTRPELVLLVLSVPVALFLTPDFGKRLALVGSLLFLMIVELLNTAIEKIGDRITGEQDKAIGRIKDMGSAAVGLSLLLAGAIWLWIVAERLWP